jgi:16S rRNA (guanine966-N2)-methyltransferase
VFSILSTRLPDSRFLDLYAGTGAVGIEAVSRGAQRVLCVESNGEALKLLHRNLTDCGMHSRVMTRAQTVKQFLSRPDQMQGPYDIVFADPPYADTRDLELLLKEVPAAALFAPGAWLVVEHAAKASLAAQHGPCLLHRRYAYGDTAVSVFACPDTAPL